MAFDITLIVQSVVVILIGILTRYVIPILIEWHGRDRLEKLWRYAKIGVQAAEQLYGAGTGKEKAEYVRKFLSERGLAVSTDEVRTAIEAAVYEINSAVMEPVEAIGFEVGDDVIGFETGDDA